MSDETPLMSALDQLADAAAEAPATRWTATVLARAVADLERAARASLGTTEHDPLVVLHRRLGRAHRRLVAAPGTASPALVEAHLQALRCPGPTPAANPANDHAGPALAHAC